MTDKFNQDSVLSFRSYLQNGMNEFASGFKQSELAADILVEFIVVLSSYQEEGIRLFPIVFIGENLDKILSATRGVDPIFVGEGELNRGSVRKAFKSCAPLTEGREWAAFVTLEKDKMCYGVFRAEQSPLSPTAFESLRQTKNNRVQILGLSRLGGSLVEVRSANGKYKYINLSGDHEESKNPPKLIHDFMGIATRDASPDILHHLRSFYYRVGVDLLHANHGTLLAVTHFDKQVPEIFHDGIILEQRIDISHTISQFLSANDRDSFQRLTAWSKLLRRMTRMDGITLIDTSGAIVGYNCFIRSSSPDSDLRSSSLGGARRRAYNLLCSYLGQHLAGVIYKSQDGLTEMEVS